MISKYLLCFLINGFIGAVLYAQHVPVSLKEKKKPVVKRTGVEIKKISSSALAPKVYDERSRVIHNISISQQNHDLSASEITIDHFDDYVDPHKEFGDRLTNCKTTNLFNNTPHATQTAGVIIAKGLNAKYMGVAPDAKLVAHQTLNQEVLWRELTRTAKGGALIVNYPAGWSTGWERAEDGSWKWHGDAKQSESESYLFGYYDPSTDRRFDELLFNEPQLSFLKAAGNERGAGPGTAVEHMLVSNQSTEKSNGFRPKNCLKNYDCLPRGSNSKNVILIGSIEPPVNNDLTRSYVSSYSAVGPTDDGRIKPDLVANGSVYTTDINDQYTETKRGTSFSVSIVSGAVALLQQYNKKLYGRYMYSDEVRALLTHTATSFPYNQTNKGPNYKSGWGALNLEQAVQTLSKKDVSVLFDRLKFKKSFDVETHTVKIRALGNSPIKATLTWLDPPGESIKDESELLNNRTPMLVNDLDMRINHKDKIYMPWVLDPKQPEVSAKKGDNRLDNIEQILIENPVPKALYTVNISYKGKIRKTQEQHFSLLVSGASIEGKENQGEYNEVKVWPSPGNSEVFIQSPSDTELEIHLLNVMGTLLSKQKHKLQADRKTLILDLSKYPKGLYIVYFMYEGKKQVRKIIRY